MRLKLKFLDNPDTEEQSEWFAWYPVVTECNTLVWLEKVCFEVCTDKDVVFDCGCWFEEESIYLKYFLKERN